MKPSNDHAVSPVVGVMLMLVVTIIIAAVVTGFTSGLVGSSPQKSPTLAMTVKVMNTGSWTGSGFFATVTGVSEPIRTKDLRIVTSWTAANGGNPVSGGSRVVPNNGTSNIDTLFDPSVSLDGTTYIAPFGYGPGVNASRGISSGPTFLAFSEPRQQFGNYSLVSGTTLSATPCGALDAMSVGNSSAPATDGYGIGTRFQYSSGATGKTDAATAMLGPGWEHLRAGDKVNVKVIYIPSGSVIFNKDIPVAEG
ncbi:MAG: type IV pilin [Methanospirillum sp.]|nr:type IV pilin [Methanospirillum sp.]